MNPKQTAAELARFKKHQPVMEAFALGKEVQFKNCDGEWQDTIVPEWYAGTKYRIKPQPRTFYLLKYRDQSCDLFFSEEERNEYVESFGPVKNVEFLIVKEVLPE